MRKKINVFVVMMAIIALTASVTFAGTIRQVGDGAYVALTKAAEVSNSSGNMTGVDVADLLNANFEYKAGNFAGTISPDSWFVISLDPNDTVSSGLVWNIADSLIDGAKTPLTLCDKLNAIVATYTAGNGLEEIIFTKDGIDPQAATGNFIAGGEYYLSARTGNAATCTASDVVAAGEITIDMPAGTGDLSIEVRIVKNATTIDSDTAKFIDMKNQYSADLTTANMRLNEEIDFEEGFKQLYNSTADNSDKNNELTVTLKSAHASIIYHVDTTMTTQNDEVFSVVLTPSVTTGIKSVLIDKATSNSGSGTDACTPDDADTPTNWTCTWDAKDLDAPTTEFDIDVNVDGTTVLSGITWTATASLTFGNTAEAADWNMTSGTNMGANLFTNGNAGTWTYRGTAVYVPLVKSDAASGAETYFKFQSKDTSATGGQIRAIVLCGDGTTETVAIPGSPIVAGTPLAFTGANIKDALTCTVDGKKGFALTLNITSNAVDIYGLVTLDTASGQRRIPLSTDQAISLSGAIAGTTAESTFTGVESASGISN